MTKSEKKLVLFLAGSDFSDSEFTRLATILDTTRSRSMLEAAWSIRQQLSRGDDELPLDRSSIEESVMAEVSRLLLVEASLNKGQAIKLLAERLDLQHQLPAKIAFPAAVALFTEIAGGSRVISASQQIRNQVVHEPRSHSWPLRDQT